MTRTRRALAAMTTTPARGVMRRHKLGHCWIDAEGRRVHPMARLHGADGVHSASEWLETDHDELGVVPVDARAARVLRWVERWKAWESRCLVATFYLFDTASITDALDAATVARERVVFWCRWLAERGCAVAP